jgi:alkylated DNA nucleotide flippase Atl1
MLGRVISFGDTAYVINTMALQRTNVLGTITLERVLIWAAHPTPLARSSASHSNTKIYLTQIMLGRVISFGDTAYIINTIALQCTSVFGTIALGRVINLGDTINITDMIALRCTNVLGDHVRTSY